MSPDCFLGYQPRRTNWGRIAKTADFRRGWFNFKIALPLAAARQPGQMANVPFLTLQKIVRLLEISYDSLFYPAETQEESDIRDLTDFYRACPEDKRPVLMAMVHTLVEQLKALDG